MAQPNSCNPCAKPAKRAGSCGSSMAVDINTPMRRTLSACCARAASGHAAAAPPRSVMKSRRIMTDMGLAPPRAAGLPPLQPNTERPAGPLGNPEIVLNQQTPLSLPVSLPRPSVCAHGHLLALFGGTIPGIGALSAIGRKLRGEAMTGNPIAIFDVAARNA